MYWFGVSLFSLFLISADIGMIVLFFHSLMLINKYYNTFGDTVNEEN